MNTILELDFEDEPLSMGKTYIECEHAQRTDGWYKDRNAIVTATGFSKIVTTAGKPSTQATDYMEQLLADWIAGEDTSGYAEFFDKNVDIKNGRELEPEARELYEFITGKEVAEKNFCFRDERKDCGVSPDGEVCEEGGVEIKCVKGKTLVKYKLADKVPTTYFQQMQGQMWVMGWQWCDFFVYHPQCGHFLKRMERDNEFIEKLSVAVANFNEAMKLKRDILADV